MVDLVRKESKEKTAAELAPDIRDEIQADPAALATDTTPGLVDPVGGNGLVYSGTYTPVESFASTNIFSINIRTAQFMRVGNVVTVSGQISYTLDSVNTYTNIYLSLPIPSTFNDGFQLAGTGATHKDASDAGTTWRIGGNAAGAIIEGYPSHGGNETFAYTYTYLIV